MKLLRRLDKSRLGSAGCVVTIGSFDGIHIGHQALIARARALAADRGCESMVLSFEPLPREFFAAAAPPPRLTLPRAKVEGLRALGAEVVGLLRFDARLAAMTAEDFVERVLVGRLGAREVWVGPEFRFGKGRAGDLALLQALGARLGFRAEAIAPVALDGERVSATRVRAALAAGAFEQVARLLGRPYAIGGRVVLGNRLGRTLGYPTANLRFDGRTPPLAGIFAARVHGVGAQPWPAVASFGTRPTVGGGEHLLEAHLFDFDGDLYGRRIEVEFVARLRDELKFESLPALVAQMHQDAALARRLLGLEPQRAHA